MARMNPFRRKKALEYFKSKPKYYDKATGMYLCFCGGDYCKWKLTEKEVRVEHKNNDNSDDSHKNIRPASHSCNIRIGYQQRKQYPVMKRERVEYIDPPATMKKNIEIKAQAKVWLKTNLTADVEIHKDDAIDRLAFFCDCNILTIERLLRGLIVNQEPGCPYRWSRHDEEEFITLKKVVGPS